TRTSAVDRRDPCLKNARPLTPRRGRHRGEAAGRGSRTSLMCLRCARVWTALVPTLDGAEDGGSPVFHNEMTDKPDDADAERHGYRPGAYHGQPRPPGIFVFAHGARQSSRISRSGSRGRPQLTAVWAASTFNSQTRRSMRALRTSGSSAMPKAM